MTIVERIVKTALPTLMAAVFITSCGTDNSGLISSGSDASVTITSESTSTISTATTSAATTSESKTTSKSTTTDKSTQFSNTTTVRTTTAKSSSNTSAATSKSTTTTKSTKKPSNGGNAVQQNPPFKDTTAMKLVRDMKIGWNLGNTLDSVHWETGNNLPTKPSGFETAWGNPVTTKKMIDTVKAAGFNTLRVPVTWYQHLGDAPNYKINKAWLDRVQEVVDYGIANNMYVIINLHHENWHFPSYENMPTAKVKLQKVWEQIADRFKNYDEHLIFEAMNEPRMNGTTMEWTGGNAEARDVINQLNATFVNTIRKSKGNNPKRFLMLPTYAASPWDDVTSSMKIPNNDSRVIVSVHSYEPYNFALNIDGGNSWKLTNSRDTGDIDNLMDSLYNRFISKGIPVVMGEFGALNKDNLPDRVAWAEYYIRAAKERGITCVWWDNGAFSGEGENFGLLNRRQNKWQYPEIVKALMEGIK